MRERSLAGPRLHLARSRAGISPPTRVFRHLRMIRPSKTLAPLLLAAAAVLGGCTTHYIPNTDVEDNEENRKIVTNHDAFGYFARRYRLTIVGAVLTCLAGIIATYHSERSIKP